MRRRIVSLLATWLYACSALSAQLPATGALPGDGWEKDLEQRHVALVERNGPGTDALLREKLIVMGKQDQEARGFHDGVAPTETGLAAMSSDLAEIDRRLTSQLREIVMAHGWPTIALVGPDASNAAMLILIHTADHAWQRSLLPRLEALVRADKIDGSSLALVVDRELVSEGKLQRYGSQFKLMNGTIAMLGAEDPANLDRRRALALLPPMDAYKQMLAGIYHLKISDKVVRATPAKL